MPDQTKSKRRLFCCFYVQLGSITEAARHAGFGEDEAYLEGVRTLQMPAYQRLVQRLAAQPPVSAQALVETGLARLAFGSANDAAYLVCAEELPDPERLRALDLFNVSELKRVKGGGVEVKFFDRQRALERMYEYAGSADSSRCAQNLIAALTGEASGEADAHEI